MENKTKVIISVVIALLLIVIITLASSFTVIPTGTVGVKVRFGEVQSSVITEGLNMKAPFVEDIVKINCKTQKIEVTTEASSKDLQTVDMSIAVNYNVEKDTANTLYREIGTEYESIIIHPAILESAKSIVAQYTAEELITKRAEVSAMIQEALFNKIHDRGFNITEFNITNINFSDAFDAAIEAKAVKQQEVQTAQAELEKQKIQNEKEISIAEKDAEVMKLQNQEITDKTLQLKALEIKEKMINKWSGNFPSTMMSSDVNALFNMN